MPLVKPGVYISEVDHSTVIPVLTGWKDKLRSLYQMNIMDRSEDNYEFATAMMQKDYPGPYTIDVYYNNELGTFDYRLKFEDPKEQTLWLLKYSNR